MFMPTFMMGVIAVIMVLIGYLKGGDQHIAGLKSAVNMFIEILPMLILAFVVAGMAQVLFPHEIISKWIGRESGVRGILIGTLAGGLCPGGPYVSLPIAAGFLRSGAGVATMVAFVTSWSLWAVARLPMEIGIMGWRFTVIRMLSTFFFPPIAGLIAQLFFPGAK